MCRLSFSQPCEIAGGKIFRVPRKPEKPSVSSQLPLLPSSSSPGSSSCCTSRRSGELCNISCSPHSLPCRHRLMPFPAEEQIHVSTFPHSSTDLIKGPTVWRNTQLLDGLENGVLESKEETTVDCHNVGSVVHRNKWYRETGIV